MIDPGLERALFDALCQVPIIDPHSHVDPLHPVSRTLDDILGYHYYTELAHSAGMGQECLAPDFNPRERASIVLEYLERCDNTVQYRWLVEIARSFLEFEGDRITAGDTHWLWSAAERQMARPDWENQVLSRSNVEKVFLTNEFDDPLEGFDAGRYVPCLRADDLVFRIGQPEIRQRFAAAVGSEPGDVASLRSGLMQLFDRFVRRGAKCCAISLPPHFVARPAVDPQAAANRPLPHDAGILEWAVFWLLSECCRDFQLPLALMYGVNRNVYADGVERGRDLFDQRASLIQLRELFNAFPEVTFCVSVLSSGLNQELASYAWIFPNVFAFGHWWYSNLPTYIESDARARLQCAPKTKQIGYYSDAYKLEFILPKYNMYRRGLARVLAKDYVADQGWTEERAVGLARCLLRDNVQRIFRL